MQQAGLLAVGRQASACDPINCYDLDGKIAWGKWIDRAGTGLAVAGLFGCAACAAVAAGISLGRGIYKVSRGDRGGWFDIAGAGAFGAARGVRYFNNVRKSKAIGNAWKGAKGKGRHFRRIRQKASARHRSYNRRVVRKADRIDRRYGYFSTAKQGYDEYRDYRKTRRWY